MISALRGLKKQTVVVHLLSGVSLQGILKATYRNEILLAHVRHLDEKVDLDGEILVPRESIDFYQTVST